MTKSSGRSRHWLVPIVGALLCGVAASDDSAKDTEEKRERPKSTAEVEIPEPGTPIQDGAVASQEIARFQKAMREAKTPVEEAAALEQLGRWDHPDIVKAASKYLKDKEVPVAVAAIVACARQSTEKGRERAGAEMFKQLRRDKRTEVICALLVGMGAVGYDNKSAVKEAMKHFTRDTTLPHLAATRYLGYIRHKEAFRALAEKLDEPKSTLPVDDERNPSASWWKERWDEWDRNVPYTRWAIDRLVPNERFATTAEAKIFAEQSGAAHGIEW